MVTDSPVVKERAVLGTRAVAVVPVLLVKLAHLHTAVMVALDFKAISRGRWSRTAAAAAAVLTTRPARPAVKVAPVVAVKMACLGTKTAVLPVSTAWAAVAVVVPRRPTTAVTAATAVQVSSPSRAARHPRLATRR